MKNYINHFLIIAINIFTACNHKQELNILGNESHNRKTPFMKYEKASFTKSNEDKISTKEKILIPKSNLFVSHDLKNISCFHQGNDFFVVEKNVEIRIKPENLNKRLRNLFSNQIIKSYEFGYYTITKIGNEYKIEYKERLLGGGPISGAIAYWATKAACYSAAAGVAAGAVSGAVASAPVVGGAITGAIGVSATGMGTTGRATSC